MSLPIITYHALGDVPSPLWTPLEVFEAQLAMFAANGYRTVTLAEVLAHLRRGEPLPDPVLVITFDDGYDSVYREAWPRLRAWGFGATVFLVSGYCGRDNWWPGQPASVPVAPLLTWQQVAVLAAEGCELGAHTHTHPSLSTLSPEAIEEEILTSQRCIQARTGQAGRVLAYPYGATSAVVIEMVRRHFDGAVGTQLGLVGPGSDCFKLARIDAHYLAPRWIPQMHSALFRHYLHLRQRLRSIRRRLHPDWQPISNKDVAHA